MCLWTNIFTAYSWHKCCMLVDTSGRRRLNAFEILFIYFKRSRTILFRVEREGKRRESDVKGDSIFLKTRRRERLKRERLTPLLFKVYWPRLHVYVAVSHFYLLFDGKLEFRRDTHRDGKTGQRKLPSILSFRVTWWNAFAIRFWDLEWNILYFGYSRSKLVILISCTCDFY